MFAAVIKIQQFYGFLPSIFFEVPHPLGTVAQIQHLLGTPKPFTHGFPIEPSSQFQRLVLPIDHQLVDQQAAPSFCLGRRLVAIEHSQLQFVPFHAVFLGFLFAPARPPIAELAAVGHQNPQLAGRTLGQAFGRWLGIPSLRLFLGQRALPLYQCMERCVINALRPPAGYWRRLLIGTGRRYRETKLLGKPGRQLLMRPQLPGGLDRATPATGVGVLSVINDEFYLAQLAA